jgi:pimeloyl-ACP methyl ester carboxylesterase
MNTLLLFAVLTAPFQVQVHPAPGKPSMILIPGLSCHGSVWDATVAHLRGRYEMHVLTLAGFAGAAPLPQRENFLEQQREALAAYIREKGLRQPALVGHSLGGFLALSLAARHPDLPGPLVIVDSLPFLTAAYQPGATAESARPFAEGMKKMTPRQPGDEWTAYNKKNPALAQWLSREEDRARVADWGAQSDPATVAEAMFDLMTTDLRAGVERITRPTLVLAALKGMPEGAVETYRQQFARLPGVRVEPVPGARHFIMYDDPDRMHSLMDEFLGKAR